jgi:hypothetical protein
MMAAREDNWGPWAKAIGEAERLARLRALRAFLQDTHGTTHPLYRALYWAESGEPEDMEALALELDRFPALDKRRLLARWGAMFGYKAQRDAAGASKKEDA